MSDIHQSKVQELFNEMLDEKSVQEFEREYNQCFLQECASISTFQLTFTLNHVMMSLYNTYHENLDPEQEKLYVEDEVIFDDYGTGINGLSFNCTEEEFNAANLKNKHIQYSDMHVLKKMYSTYSKYLDMNAVNFYNNRRKGN